MRVLYLIRGLPGSGKTTLANRLAPRYSFAADDWFTSDGKYEFDARQLPVAHAACLNNTKLVMKTGDGPIAVHNTFSQEWEAQPYFQLAKDWGYDVFVIECQNTFENTHDVPENLIDVMRNRWECLRSGVGYE